MLRLSLNNIPNIEHLAVSLSGSCLQLVWHIWLEFSILALNPFRPDSPQGAYSYRRASAGSTRAALTLG